MSAIGKCTIIGCKWSVLNMISDICILYDYFIYNPYGLFKFNHFNAIFNRRVAIIIEKHSNIFLPVMIIV